MRDDLPLEGLRVLDLSRLLPGPFLTLVLADLGAEIIKVEDPAFGSTYYEQLSRGFDFYGDKPVQILRAEVAADRMAKEWFFLPGFLLLLLLIMVQRRRATQPAF